MLPTLLDYNNPVRITWQGFFNGYLGQAQIRMSAYSEFVCLHPD